jgi:hypothetical protein
LIHSAKSEHAFLFGFAFGVDPDFDPKKIDGQVAGFDFGKTDGIFFGGDERVTAAGAGSVDGVEDFLRGEAVMVGVGAGVDEFGTEFAEPFFKAFGNGNSADGSDGSALEEIEFDLLSSKEMLEEFGFVAAFENFSMAIELTDSFFEIGQIAAIAFGQENGIGSFEVIAGFPESSARQDVFVAEGMLAVDEGEVDPFFKGEILIAIVENDEVDSEFFDGEAGTFDPVFIDENEDIAKIGSEHEGFVTGTFRVEEKGAAIGDDARGIGRFLEGNLPPPAGEEGAGHAFVTATEDGDATSVLGKDTGEEFDDWGFAGAADGEVADADDGATDRVTFQPAVVIEVPAPAHDLGVEAGKDPSDGAEEAGAKAFAFFEDDLNGELFELFEGAVGHGENGVEALVDEEAEAE